MFDVDDTLVKTEEFDSTCFFDAVKEVLGNGLDRDWIEYDHVSYVGILEQHLRESGLENNKDKVVAEVKVAMVNKIANHLKTHSVAQVAGAAEFIRELQRMNDVSISIATGGWHQSAYMKLESAGIDVDGITMASSDDHFARTEIMKIARSKAVGDKEVSCTYFGDGEWDKLACEELEYNFVLVGQRTQHHQHISDYSNLDEALKYIRR